MRKYLPYILILVFFVPSIIALLIPFKVKDDKILYIKRNYNLTSFIDRNDYLSIEVFVNNKKSYFIDKKQITHSYLTDNELSSIIDIQIEDIINNDYELKYENEKYYSYTLIFKILFKSDSFLEWYIDDTRLMIGYNGNKEYDLEIGNFSLIKLEPSNNIITISGVNPLISEINNNQYLTGLVLGIRSIKDEQLVIEKIKIMNQDIFVGNNVSQIDCLPSSHNFNDVLGYEYINQLPGDGVVNYTITNESKYFIIPLYYEELLIVNSFPIEITIRKNNEEFKYYYSGVPYYDVITETIIKDNILIYEIL